MEKTPADEVVLALMSNEVALDANKASEEEIIADALQWFRGHPKEASALKCATDFTGWWFSPTATALRSRYALIECGGFARVRDDSAHDFMFRVICCVREKLNSETVN